MGKGCLNFDEFNFSNLRQFKFVNYVSIKKSNRLTKLAIQQSRLGMREPLSPACLIQYNLKQVQKEDSINILSGSDVSGPKS